MAHEAVHHRAEVAHVRRAERLRGAAVHVLGGGGARLGRHGEHHLLAADAHLVAGRKVKAVDTTGAGDCFVGALAAQLASEAALYDALVYANAAASICVQRMGAAPSMPEPTEVSEALAPGDQDS